MMQQQLAAYEQRLTIQGPSGCLEAILATPAMHAKGIAIICHPHPLYRGTMYNKVVHTVAKTFYQAGYLALRFNYRGVGNSEGQYGDMIGEVADLCAVREWVLTTYPNLPISLIGFSFGSVIALRVASEHACQRLISIAPPVGRLFNEPFTIAQPWLVVQGDQDEVVDPNKVDLWVASLQPAPQYTVLHNCSHFFHGKLGELQTTISEFIRATN